MVENPPAMQETRVQSLGWNKQERVRCMERVTWKLTLPCLKQIANGNLLYGSVNSNRSSVSTLDGWDVEGDGGEVQKRGDICIPMADSC